jgi:ubiquinone/menaquinone biosynthesis C-methylase UbiE
VSAWYEDTFGRYFLSLYPHRNDEEATRDISGLLQLVDPPRDKSLLDLCCGAGRHLVALRLAGFTSLTGLDLSADLLAEARARLDAAAMDDIQLLKADMREIPGDDCYSTIISLFTSFGYFADSTEDERVLASAYRALSGNGTFVLDTLNRGHVLASLIPTEEKELGKMCISIRRHITEDGLRVEKETRVTQPGSPETTYQESVRMYERQEIEDMLGRIGFVNARFFGNLQGGVFSNSSPRMVFVASKAAS